MKRLSFALLLMAAAALTARYLEARAIKAAELHFPRACLQAAHLTPKSDCRGPSIDKLVCTDMGLTLDVSCGKWEVRDKHQQQRDEFHGVTSPVVKSFLDI